MFFFKIILSIIALLIVLVLIEGFNRYTRQKAHYAFFTLESFFHYAGGYILLYAGYRMIESNWRGDIFNGIIVALIGTIVLVIAVRKNFKHTPIRLALGGTMLQLLIYLPATVLAVFALAIAVVAASGIKPVYAINGKD